MSAGAPSHQQRASDLLQLELEVVLILGIELGSFSRAVHAPNKCAISPSPPPFNLSGFIYFRSFLNGITAHKLEGTICAWLPSLPVFSRFPGMVVFDCG